MLGVLETVLSKQEWLVGGKLTVADISFITYVLARAVWPERKHGTLRRCSWNQMAIGWGLEGVEGGDVQKEFPNVYK